MLENSAAMVATKHAVNTSKNQQPDQSGFSFKQEKTSVSLVRIKPWLELLLNICTLQKPSKAYWKKMLGLKISSKRDQKMS